MAATSETMMAATHKPNALVWLWLSAGLIALDQWSKALAVAKLVYLQPVPVIEGFWNWTLMHNTGAAFSFLADSGGWQRWLFAALAVGISAALGYGLCRTARRDWRTAMPFALVIAGGLGNLVDRLRFGYVVDFIQWYWNGYYWPAFNVADSCIVVGAVLIGLLGLRSAPKGQG